MKETWKLMLGALIFASGCAHAPTQSQSEIVQQMINSGQVDQALAYYDQDIRQQDNCSYGADLLKEGSSYGPEAWQACWVTNGLHHQRKACIYWQGLAGKSPKNAELAIKEMQLGIEAFMRVCNEQRLSGPNNWRGAACREAADWSEELAQREKMRKQGQYGWDKNENALCPYIRLP